MNNIKKLNKDNGITLLGLIITIIVILILAAITLMFAFGKNGVLTQTENSRIQTDIAREKELIRLEVYGSYGDDSPKLHIDILDYHVRKNIPNTITNGATDWPLKITYTDSLRSYFVDMDGNIIPLDNSNQSFDISSLIPGPEGPFINYRSSSGDYILCRVLYNDERGIEIISDDILKNSSGQTITYTCTYSDGENSLNYIAESYRNRIDKIAISARCVGYYSSDFNQLCDLDAAKASGNYLYNVFLSTGSGCDTQRFIQVITTNNGVATKTDFKIVEGVTSYPCTSGYRPVFKLNYGKIKIASGTGTREDPFILQYIGTEMNKDEFTDKTYIATEPDSPGQINFSTNYGTIEVIWLSEKSNTVTDAPNSPNLKGMTPVSWTYNGSYWVEDSPAKAVYYNYTPAAGTESHSYSYWANAKNSDGSYFVWIPRFAYRITYYDSMYSTTPTGYYDGFGQWRASDNKIRIALDEGIKTVVYDNKSYIVHPAFCGTSVGFDNGSWDSELTGFWVAKYHMTESSNTTIVSTPTTNGSGYRTVSESYTLCKNYDSSKDSHLIKNSEWGAVAYLAHSQYGVNGYNISYASNSTTNNQYGVFNMGGNSKVEYVAAYNGNSTSSYLDYYGSSFASTTNQSTKYVTRYYNDTTYYSGNSVVYVSGKIGDATKEVNTGGAYSLNDTNARTNWFSDHLRICTNDNPFFKRGGNYSGSDSDYGIFAMAMHGGYGYSNIKYRVVLCP